MLLRYVYPPKPPHRGRGACGGIRATGCAGGAVKCLWGVLDSVMDAAGTRGTGSQSMTSATYRARAAGVVCDSSDRTAIFLLEKIFMNDACRNMQQRQLHVVHEYDSCINVDTKCAHRLLVIDACLRAYKHRNRERWRLECNVICDRCCSYASPVSTGRITPLI